MISNLHIKNIGIIEDLTVELGNKFNVFTGETGAGKTLIIDAINIISGGRFSKEMIRRGEDHSFVELNLYLPENEIAIDGNIIVSREIHTNGRNYCKINGRLVTVTELKEFMNNIIDIHGQNDNQKILNPKFHIKYLDNFGGETLITVLKKYKENYKKYCEIKRKLKENFGDEKEKQRRLSLLQYEFDEIEEADLKEGEEEKLKEKSLKYENADRIIKSLSVVSQNTNEAVDKINYAIKAIDQIEHIDKKYEKMVSELKSIYYEIEEFSRDINSVEGDCEFNEENREEIEERLDLIYSLKRKYGNSIQEILEFKKSIEQEIQIIENADKINTTLKEELKKLEDKLKSDAKILHDMRCDIAVRLEQNINEQLKDLEMANAKFFVNIQEDEIINSRGLDKIQFYISTNVGEEKKELEKIASGGEMSRIMLAIKTVLADSDKTPIMIFDEIDTGISGKAAKSVGQKLKTIGNKHQVVCITHQPSIAAKGDQNYFIGKITSNNRTHTVIKQLKEKEIIDEIARIANGDVTDAARKHAEELRKTA